MADTLIARPPARKVGPMPPVAAPAAGRSLTLKAGARAVDIPGGVVRLKGTLAWPCHPSGFVLFTRVGRGKQASLQDLRLAAQLQTDGLGTLLIDRIIGPRGTDSDLKAGQFRAITEWLARQPESVGLPVGCLGIDVGAAAALVAAGLSARIGAVVSYGGNPDVLGELLFAVRAPTLLIVGNGGYERLRHAHPALVRPGGLAWLTTIPGTGALQDGRAPEEAGRRAALWFVRHLIMEPAWRADHARGR